MDIEYKIYIFFKSKDNEVIFETTEKKQLSYLATVSTASVLEFSKNLYIYIRFFFTIKYSEWFVLLIYLPEILVKINELSIKSSFFFNKISRKLLISAVSQE